MLQQFLEELLLRNPGVASPAVASYYLKRVAEGKVSRDENILSHFCVYFIAFDPKNRKVFIGHHIKSDLWLCNGGHVDRGETPQEAMRREMQEEWGVRVSLKHSTEPLLLEITPITSNPEKVPCREHLDICYFIPVDKHSFHPDPEKLAKEFHETKWLTLKEAEKRTTDPTTLKSLTVIERLIHNIK